MIVYLNIGSAIRYININISENVGGNTIRVWVQLDGSDVIG